MRTGKCDQSKLLTVLCRAWNEENRDYEVRRAQIYMLQGFILSGYALGIKTIISVVYN